jgi:putative phosphoribosyl transferase
METRSAPDPFQDRFDAGRQLAWALQDYADANAVVLGLARGGVEVGAAVAEALHLPLRALVVRKVRAPRNPELAVGAVSETGLRWIDRRLKGPTGASEQYLEDAVASEEAEAKRQHHVYGLDDLHDTVQGRTAILVDDGIATGATALVAIKSVRDLGATRVVLATPVSSTQATSGLAPFVDEVIALVTPEPFQAVGLHYRHFDQVDDETVVRLLRAARSRAASDAPAAVLIDRREIEVPAGSVMLPAILAVPMNATGIVVFAHGSGSGRHSPRNAMVARVLEEAGLATMLADLLIEEEALDRRKVFDIELLAPRLLACVAYAHQVPQTSNLPCGLFGASTGAAAALVAATDPSARIWAIVSRGGRPDLAADALERVECPTLLLVGGDDDAVIRLNQHAFDRLRGVKELVLIPGATHLFEEPGALDEVARAARDWFRQHLPG